MALRSFLSDLLGVLYVWVNGTPQTQSTGLEFVGTGVSATYDVANNRNVITIEGGGEGGGVGGTTGATDNAITRADGTGGTTLQGSLAFIDDTGYIQAPFRNYRPTAVSGSLVNWNPGGDFYSDLAGAMTLNTVGAVTATGIVDPGASMFRPIVYNGPDGWSWINEATSTAANRLRTPNGSTYALNVNDLGFYLRDTVLGRNRIFPVARARAIPLTVAASFTADSVHQDRDLNCSHASTPIVVTLGTTFSTTGSPVAPGTVLGPFFQGNAAAVSFLAGSGATIVSRGGATPVLAAQYSPATAHYQGSGVWLVCGDFTL